MILHQVRFPSRLGGSEASLIRITDNSGDIPTAEIELTFKRHATSKIGSISELNSILSLSFRDEALSSIAAIAQIDIVTLTTGEPVNSNLATTNSAVTG